MTYVIQWDSQSEPPDGWINLLTHCLVTGSSVEEALIGYGVIYEDHRLCNVSGIRVKPARLIFESEKHCTLFLLKWT